MSEYSKQRSLWPHIDWGHIVFVLSVCLSYLIVTYNFSSARDRDFIFFACITTNNALSNDTKVIDLVTLTVNFVLNIALSDFVATRGIVIHEHILFEMK